jgi:predicted RecB family nuclease
MKPNWKILQAMQYCPYKAWQISREPPDELETPQLFSAKISAIDKIALIAYAYFLSEGAGEKMSHLTIFQGKEPFSIQIKPSLKAEKLLADTRRIINGSAPIFYKNKHCPECQFWKTCYQKLKDKDCISLLGNISPKIIERYHKKGIFTILQLSHLFRPRRRSRRKPKIASNYLWELKALAIREQKTYVMYTPDIESISEAIYLDFEGLPDERFIYLIGGIVHFENKPDETFSFWADSRENEKEIFRNLFRLLNQYPDLKIYHYGSYEIRFHGFKKEWQTCFLI